MPQSLAQILIHLVFSTKNREPLLTTEKLAPTISYLAGTLNAIGCPAIAVGGGSDHVHLLFALKRTLSVSDAVEEIKKGSSKWAKAAIHPNFYWQKATALSRSARPSSNKQSLISRIKKHIIKPCRSRTSTAHFCASTASNGTNDSSGIEPNRVTTSGRHQNRETPGSAQARAVHNTPNRRIAFQSKGLRGYSPGQSPGELATRRISSSKNHRSLQGRDFLSMV